MIKKIISGGQTGADQAGWAAADELKITKGGWMPKGFRTEECKRPEFTWTLEHESSEYPPRTTLNIQESDGTIVFGKIGEPGTALTIKLAKLYKKPLFIVPFGYKQKTEFLEYQDFGNWIKENYIQILNVAGNRESKNFGIFIFVRNYLIENIRKLQ